LTHVQQEIDLNKRNAAHLQTQLLNQEKILSNLLQPSDDLKITFNSTFDGDRSKSIHFIDDLNMYFSLHPGATDAKKLYLAQSCMRGDAKDWFHNEVKLQRWKDWAEFENDFLTFFTDHVSRNRADEELRLLRQSSSGDCSKHIQRFQNIVERSSLDRKNVKMLVSFFLNSLNDKWRKEIQRLSMIMPTLLDSFSAVAKTLLQIEGIETSFIPSSSVSYETRDYSPMEVDAVKIHAVSSSAKVDSSLDAPSTLTSSINAVSQVNSGTQMSLNDFQEFKSWCLGKGVCHFCLRQVRANDGSIAHEPLNCSYREIVKEMRMDKRNKAKGQLYLSSFNAEAQVPINFDSLTEYTSCGRF
jgi:hypothetical protein